MWAEAVEEITARNMACGIVTIIDTNIPLHPAAVSATGFEAEPGQEEEPS